MCAGLVEMGTRTSLQDLLLRIVGAAAAVSVLVVIGTVGVVVLQSGRIAAAESGAPALSYPVGGTIDLPRHLYDGTRATVVVFATSGCGASQRSTEALGSIARATAELPGAHMIMIVPGSDDARASQEREFGQKAGLPASSVFALDLKELRVDRVPTVTVVDERGRILFSHEGVLGAADSRRILDVVRQAVSIAG